MKKTYYRPTIDCLQASLTQALCVSVIPDPTDGMQSEVQGRGPKFI